uniref:Peptide-methionine (R)-S-oxide reductase n=1 Tax=Plectus sambesii TaxID=2011161 RepID=A0A914XQB2_9BILA
MAESTHTKDDGQLTEQQREVLRNAATEDAGSGKYDKFYEAGNYTCVGCGTKLFSSETKYDSGSGWPSFYKAENEQESIVRIPDHSVPDRPRVEVRCKKCDGHLGHVFQDGPQESGERFCINSCVIQHQTK